MAWRLKKGGVFVIENFNHSLEEIWVTYLGTASSADLGGSSKYSIGKIEG